MRSKWLNICVIVFTTILWVMQMIPQEKDGECVLLPYLREYKYWIALISFSLVIFYHTYDIIIARAEIQKKWIKKFLQQIVNLDLGGNNYHTRISILCPRKGYQIFFSRFFFFVILRFIENFKERAWKRSIKQIPVHFLSDYLIVYQRFSYPQEKKSYTYFRIQEGNGVAVKCFMEGVDVEVNTNCISGIKLPQDYSKLSQTNKKLVKKYMCDSYICDGNYGTLLTMVKRANNIYATPIINEHQHVWGVLIIDNDEQEQISFKQKIDPVIDRYVKLFVFTVSHLRMK